MKDKQIDLGIFGIIWWQITSYSFYLAWQTRRYSSGHDPTQYSNRWKFRIMLQHVGKKWYFFLTRKDKHGTEY